MKQTSNQGPQTEAVKQALVRLIRDEQLAPGSRLPTQLELRQRLNVGSVTVTRAIQALQQDGVLDIRGKTGVFLRDPDADGHLCRKIGLVCSRAIATPFATIHIASTELQLHDAGCQSIHFQRSKPGISVFDGFAFYHGLKRNLEQHLIDGLIAFALFDDDVLACAAANRIPVVYANSCEDRENSVHIDVRYMVHESVRRLVAGGFRRPALIAGAWPSMELYRDSLAEALAKYLHQELRDEHCCFLGASAPGPALRSNPLDWLQRPLDRFLTQPPAARPDVLLILDDLTANWVEAALWRHSDWHPEIISLVNVQLPIAHPQSGIGYFEFDIMEYAGVATDMLLKMLREGVTRHPMIRYRPRFVPAGAKKTNVNRSESTL